MLQPADEDLGELRLDTSFDHSDYYAGYDFHRQQGGIWRDDRGALAAGFAEVSVHDWYPTGTASEPSADTWSTPWALLVARKEN